MVDNERMGFDIYIYIPKIIICIASLQISASGETIFQIAKKLNQLIQIVLSDLW